MHHEQFEEAFKKLRELMKNYNSYAEYSEAMLSKLNELAADAEDAKVPNEIKNVCGVVSSKAMQCESALDVIDFSSVMVIVFSQTYRAGFAAGMKQQQATDKLYSG